MMQETCVHLLTVFHEEEFMSHLARVLCVLGMFALAVPIVNSKPNPEPGDRSALAIVFNDGRQRSYPMAEIARIEGTFAAARGANSKPAAIVVIFRDGRQQSFPMAEIASIDFKASAARSAALGRNHFIGKWRVGDGSGQTFYITLDPDGSARKSIGASHGTWTVVDEEARISWDDGWHDAIRKVGTKHEKFAYGAGKSFSDEPDNVTDARNIQAKPI